MWRRGERKRGGAEGREIKDREVDSGYHTRGHMPALF